MRAVSVTPMQVEQEGTQLTGIEWGACEITAAYYSDTRVSGKLVTHEAWPRNQWVRIYDNNDNALGTFIVTNAPASRNNGEWVSELTLHSVLWGMGQQKAYGDWTVSKNTMCSTALRRIFEWCGIEGVIDGMADYRFSSAVLLERGRSLLSWAYSLCNLSGNRLDVDAYGRPTVTPAVIPSKIPQNHVVSISDGIIGGLSRESDELSLPGRVIVVYQSDDKIIEAHADATGDASMVSRGYLLTDYQEVSDLSPATYSGALAKARTLLALNSTAITTWELYGKELWWPGTGVTLRTDDPMFPGDRPCFVCNLTMSQLNMDKPVYNMTLKEVTGRDEA